MMDGDYLREFEPEERCILWARTEVNQMRGPGVYMAETITMYFRLDLMSPRISETKQ